MSTPKHSSAEAIGVYRASFRPKYTGLPGREVQNLLEILLLFAEFLLAADGHIAARQSAIPPGSSLQVSLNVERFSGR
jgi:hypothetical protein